MTRSQIWHPFTQHAIFKDIPEIVKAEGVYLHKKDGSKIIDGISSWWVNTHGHCHPKIVQAVQDQAEELDQVIFAGLSHPKAEEFSEKLLHFTGRHNDYVFFSDSGSTAVEVAIKMAIGYWNHKGQERTHIIAMEGGYHGDTFGTMSVSARDVFTNQYENFLFTVDYIPRPEAGAEEQSYQKLKEILEREKGNVAAFICEPLVQGAGGMNMYEAQALKEIYDQCKAFDTLFIADEVMTGFGRTGTKFACDQAGFSPDLLCLSKGITGGFLPMGVTLAPEEIYKAFYDQDRSKTFFHSSSFTGNALSCAAALASIEIWEDEPVLDRIQNLSKQHAGRLKHFENRDDVTNIRQAGTIAALDVIAPDSGYLANIGPTLYNHFLNHNILLRPLGNTIYILPPYCIQEEELNVIYNTIEGALDFIRDGREKHAA